MLSFETLFECWIQFLNVIQQCLVILKNWTSFECFQKSIILIYYFENHFAINESTIKFHELNKNKFQLRYKLIKKSFIIYVLINNKNILHNFILWDLRNDFEYNKKNITINIFSRTIRKCQKNIIEVIVMKIHFLLIKKIIYIFCERITHNL